MDARPSSGHLMLITPERVFYAGLLGRPSERCPGSFHIYVALRGGLSLTTADGRQMSGELIAVAPNTRHTIASDYRSAICITIEPESVPDGTFEIWDKRLQGIERDVFAQRIRLAYETLLAQPCRSGMSNSDFDRLCFGETLPQRKLDLRIVQAMARIGKFSGEPLTADICAAEAGLSASRFLHLFKQETGVSFRSFRAWKRARHLLHFANQDINLAHLAQDIGYPDSTHFSHSIRRFYGLRPRAIFSASRDLAIYRSGQEAGSIG
jgi:AraC-like DNA-binding protein